MNKKDLFLIIVVLAIACSFLFINHLVSKDPNMAYVYYDGNLIKEIHLNHDAIYTVTGYQGPVTIEVLNQQIRVQQESSPLHLCSKQGFVSAENQSIICLPNKIVITLGTNELYDAIVK